MSWKERMIKLCGQLRPWLPALALAAVAMTPNLAFALATPVDGDFGYDVYGIMAPWATLWWWAGLSSVLPSGFSRRCSLL